MTKLSAVEKNHNQAVTENLFTLIDDLPADYDLLPLQQLVLTFAELLDSEEMELVEILSQATKLDLAADADKAKLQQALTQWKDKLHHAVYGKGASVVMHAAQVTSMSASLLKSGSVPEAQWGTDLDILQCLKQSIVLTSQITAANDTYILSPVSLTESQEAIKDKLADALDTIKKKNINTLVTLSIPVNCGNNHWRLVKAQVKNQALTSVELWDSMGGNVDALKMSVAYQNLQAATNSVAGKVLPVTPIRKGIQKNGYSCMDYVIREALFNNDQANEITECKEDEPKKLRLAVLKMIAKNHPDLGEAVANELVADVNVIRNPDFVAAAHVADDDELSGKDAALFDNIQKHGVPSEFHIAFDATLAQQLSHLYQDTKTDEKILFNKALKLTLRECGMFSKKKPGAKTAASTATDDADADAVPSSKKPTVS
jgi:hypothetical protein